MAAAQAEAEQARERDLAGLAELEERLRAGRGDAARRRSPPLWSATSWPPRCRAARQHEIEVRLAVRTAEERVAALAGRADALARQAAAERAGPGAGRGPPRGRAARGARSPGPWPAGAE